MTTVKTDGLADGLADGFVFVCKKVCPFFSWPLILFIEIPIEAIVTNNQILLI